MTSTATQSKVRSRGNQNKQGPNPFQDEEKIDKILQKQSDKATHWFSSFDKIMRFIFGIYIIMIMLMIRNIISIEHYFLSLNLPATNFKEFLLIIPGFFISLFIWEAIRYFTRGFIIKYKIEHNRIKETKEGRIRRVQAAFNSIIYYSICVGINYFLIITYAPDYMPVTLGGSLNIDAYPEIWPTYVCDPVRIFFVLSIGHHFERTYQHIANNLKGNNFWIMIVHHIVTITLMVCCYCNRQFLFGIPILFLHDIGDIFVGIMRLVREITFLKFLTIPCFFSLFVVWVFTRVYIFGTEIFFDFSTSGVFKMTDDFVVNQYFAVGGMAILMFLNVYWTFGMIVSGYQKLVVKTGEAMHFEGETVDRKAERRASRTEIKTNK